jgi:hypothetical protein
MDMRDVTPLAGRAYVSADLPDLNHVPAEVGGLRCPSCGQRTAVVRHVPRGDGTYSAVNDCSYCGDNDTLWMTAYTTGLEVGVIVEAARRGDPRVAREGRDDDQHPAGTGYPFTLTFRDISCITRALEAISGSTSGNLVPDAPRILAADPEWREPAISLCERLEAVLPAAWNTRELRDMIARGGSAPE